jgi:hypothetical protein
MPDEPEQPDRSWLLAPLGPNDVRIHVDIGDGVEISEEARAALDTLVNELQASEVEGFVAGIPRCPSLLACGEYRCEPLGKCTFLTRSPCFSDVTCAIQKLV